MAIVSGLQNDMGTKHAHDAQIEEEKIAQNYKYVQPTSHLGKEEIFHTLFL